MLKYQFLFLLYSVVVFSNDFGSIEDKVKGIVKEKQLFERLEMKKEDLFKMFEVWSNLYFYIFNLLYVFVRLWFIVC